MFDTLKKIEEKMKAEARFELTDFGRWAKVLRDRIENEDIPDGASVFFTATAPDVEIIPRYVHGPQIAIAGLASMLGNLHASAAIGKPREDGFEAFVDEIRTWVSTIPDGVSFVLGVGTDDGGRALLFVRGNEITVSGTNLLNETASDTIVITRGGIGTCAPYVDFTNSNIDSATSSTVRISGVSTAAGFSVRSSGHAGAADTGPASAFSTLAP